MITVRLATLQDSAAITAIHTSNVVEWIDYEGLRRAYDDLSLYERWLHGGAWMSIETCAVHLNRLLAGAGIPLVAEQDGRVFAEAEVYENFEASPYDHHLNIGVLYTHSDFISHGYGTALLNYIRQMAHVMGCARVTVTQPDAPEFYTGYSFKRTRAALQVRLPTQSGRSPYQAGEITERSAQQIKGAAMPLGRYSAPAQEWLSLFPQDWAAGLPELLNARMSLVKITAAGQNAIVYLKESEAADRQPGDCTAACWTLRPMSAPLLAAIRDRAHREGYRALVTCIAEADWPLFENADATLTGERFDGYELAL